MPTPLTSNQTQALNNLPGFPPSKGLSFGDVIRDLVVGFAGSTIVWRPGEPNPQANVFADWAGALAAAQQTPGLVNIMLDDSLAGLTIPAGTYDFQNRIGLVAGNSGSTALVDLSDGVVFQNPGEWRSPLRLVEMRSHSSTPILTAVAGTTLRLVLENFRLASDGAAPFIDTPAGTTTLTTMRNGADLNGGAGTEAVDTEGTFVALMLAGTSLTGAYATGGGAFTAVIHSTSADAPAPGGSFSGVFSLSLDTDAASVLGYTPGDSGNWSGDPTTATEALDRIAAAVAGLLLGPIP